MRFRRTAAVATATAVLAGVTAAPAEAASKRNSATIRFGHWYSKHGSKWEVTTQNARRDWARICLLTSDTVRANVRIYAYDSKGRMIGSYARDDMRFEYWTGCARLTLPSNRHARSALFRINVKGDGYGEKAKRLGFKS